MKTCILSIFFLSVFSFGYAQSGPCHKIVFQLTVNDIPAHKALMKQPGNISTVAPDAKTGIVSHGPGPEKLQVATSKVAGKAADFALKVVDSRNCEFSVKDHKVDKSQILPSAGFVEEGILEIVSKQEKSGRYFKPGF